MGARAEALRNPPKHRWTGALSGIRRDGEGRVLVPVRINGHGPFQFVVNTGAARSALSAAVAHRLALPLADKPAALVHGVTGSIPVPMAQVASLKLGPMLQSDCLLPVVPNTFGDADGFLSLTDFVEECVLIDFQNNRLSVPKGMPPAGTQPGVVTLRMNPAQQRLIAVSARIHGTTVAAVLDTGTGTTLGNLALQHALPPQDLNPEKRIAWESTTHCGLISSLQPLPIMELGSLRILGARITYADLPLFSQLHLASTPAMLVGMDILGQFSSLVLNFKDRAIQLRRQRTP